MGFEYPAGALKKAAGVELFLFDVDGVLTDGSLYIDDEGRESKAFNSMDGAGIKTLSRLGIRTGILTGRTSNVVRIRASELGMDVVMQGARDKLAAFKEILQATSLEAPAVAYMGDDLVDLPVLTRAGFSASPPGAHPEVLKRVDYVTKLQAGKGAAREAMELVVTARGLYDRFLERYMQPGEEG
ncbi:MAG: HAD hydrolase family protein [Planctomycetes bacterium]|nr:HAD hydrolase family protein [Planctomycetota bacterium]